MATKNMLIRAGIVFRAASIFEHPGWNAWANVSGPRDRSRPNCRTIVNYGNEKVDAIIPQIPLVGCLPFPS
jgi:hypothetical protein